jgi:hypothetical protein
MAFEVRRLRQVDITWRYVRGTRWGEGRTIGLPSFLVLASKRK